MDVGGGESVERFRAFAGLFGGSVQFNNTFHSLFARLCLSVRVHGADQPEGRGKVRTSEWRPPWP